MNAGIPHGIADTSASTGVTGRLILALGQTPVSTDPALNAARIERLMRRAKAAGAHLLQLTEGALSGYGRKQLQPFEAWTGADWRRLRDESHRLASLAGELGLWLVLGSAHPLDDGRRPHNCLYVIDDRGRLVTRYDKRRLSASELAGWYTPGQDRCLIEVNGIRLGLALCIEARFPELFRDYAQQGAHGVLLSTFTAGRIGAADARQDAIFNATAQAHAANNLLWVSMVTPANPVQGARTQLIDPSGSVVAACRRHANTLAVGEIDVGEGSPWAMAAVARHWREEARRGHMYSQRAHDGPRSRERSSF